MKRLASYTFIVLATLSLIFLAWIFRDVIVIFLLSLAVSAAVRPLIDYLIARGVNRVLAILMVYLSLFLLIGGLIAVIGKPLIVELERVSDRLAIIYDQMWQQWPNGTQLQQTIIHRLPDPQSLYSAIAGQQGLAIVQTFLGVTINSFAVIRDFFVVVILSLYWSIDRIHFERLWLSLLPVDGRARARAIWRDIEDGVGSYIRSEIAQSLLTGILLGIGFTLIGLPYPVMIALFSAVFWLIPWLGAILAVIPVILVGFTTSFTIGILSTLFTILVLLLMELVIEPRLYKRAKYSSLLVVLLMIALADAFGLVGIIISPPLAAALQLLFMHLLQPPEPIFEMDTSVQKIADLDQRLDEIQDMLVDHLDSVAPQSLSMLERLNSLVDRAKDIVGDESKKVKKRKQVPQE